MMREQGNRLFLVGYGSNPGPVWIVSCIQIKNFPEHCLVLIQELAQTRLSLFLRLFHFDVHFHLESSNLVNRVTEGVTVAFRFSGLSLKCFFGEQFPLAEIANVKGIARQKW